MIVVIDTNVMLPLFSANSRHPEIVRALTDGELTWAISNSIMTEYEEILLDRSGKARWEQVLRVINLLSLRNDNILWVNPSFQFRVISTDPDDNKFCDCAITANADCVITDDAHFGPLADAGYRPQPVTPAEFVERYLNER